MKVKNNIPSKVQIRHFNEFVKCFLNWFKSLKREEQIHFLDVIKFDYTILDDLIV